MVKQRIMTMLRGIVVMNLSSCGIMLLIILLSGRYSRIRISHHALSLLTEENKDREKIVP
jgi:hypothetical protein